MSRRDQRIDEGLVLVGLLLIITIRQSVKETRRRELLGITHDDELFPTSNRPGSTRIRSFNSPSGGKIASTYSWIDS